MIGPWTIGAQLSTSHSSLAALDEQRMFDTVRRVREALDLDLLIIGFREAPEVFRRFCAPHRPVDNVYLWFSALSDINGMTEDDLVVNWRGARSRGWGGWAEKGGDVEEAFRFACPNNPAVREKTTLRLRELLIRYDFKGVFLDKIRFPSPANGADEMLSCFCDHCRRAANAQGLDLDAVVRIFGDGDLIVGDGDLDANGLSLDGSSRGNWLGSIEAANPLLARFLAFRAVSVARLVGDIANECRRLGRSVSLDLFSPSLAQLVGQDYQRLKGCCDWVKPMTYRLARGPAGLRLEVPALIEGVAQRFGLDEAQIVEWAARHASFDQNMLRQTREDAVPFTFMQREIEAAVRALTPVPVYFGLELVSQPGVIDVTPADVIGMIEAGHAANAAGLVISWDLLHAPIDGIRALAENA
jgi:hypothetical protein